MLNGNFGVKLDRKHQQSSLLMTPEIAALIKAHAREELPYSIRKHSSTVPEQLETLEGIEATVKPRRCWNTLVQKLPFFDRRPERPPAGRIGTLNSIVGTLQLTDKQAKHFQLLPYSHWSPDIEKCCLLISGTLS